MFNIFKKKIINDKYLGELKYSNNSWIGNIIIENENTKIILSGNKEKPYQESLNFAYNINIKYSEFKNIIEKELFEHYEPYRDNQDDNYIQINLSNEIWDFVAIKYINIKFSEGMLSKDTEIEIAYDVDWDAEHTVAVTIKNNEIINFCGSI